MPHTCCGLYGEHVDYGLSCPLAFWRSPCGVRYGVAFWDAFEAVPHVTSIDGVHLSPADHAAFAQAIVPQIEALL
ncbi:MAG: hypothetical protein ACLUB2_06970 [Butyricicoccus pullicaecorum]